MEMKKWPRLNQGVQARERSRIWSLGAEGGDWREGLRWAQKKTASHSRSFLFENGRK